MESGTFEGNMYRPIVTYLRIAHWSPPQGVTRRCGLLPNYFGHLLPMTTAIAGVEFYLRLSVCLSVYAHDISKTDAARLPNSYLTYKCSTTTSGNHLFWGQKSKGQRSRSRVTKILSAWVFALLWVCASSWWILHGFCTNVLQVRAFRWWSAGCLRSLAA